MRLGMDSFSFQVDPEGRCQFLVDQLFDKVLSAAGPTLVS
jgi:hypothetical protein